MDYDDHDHGRGGGGNPEPEIHIDDIIYFLMINASSDWLSPAFILLSVPLVFTATFDR